MKVALALGMLFAAAMALDQPPAEAPAAFDDKSNGMVDEATHDEDRETFEEVESIAEVAVKGVSDANA